MGKVYRRELFAQVRFPAYYTCFEDAIIHFLVFRLAKTVASVPEMVYLWRKNPKGLPPQVSTALPPCRATGS